MRQPSISLKISLSIHCQEGVLPPLLSHQYWRHPPPSVLDLFSITKSSGNAVALTWRRVPHGMHCIGLAAHLAGKEFFPFFSCSGAYLPPLENEYMRPARLNGCGTGGPA